MVDILFQATPIIRPALSTSRYERALSVRSPDEEQVGQIFKSLLEDVFPNLSQQLLDRLVGANIMRRRVLEYARNYDIKHQNDPLHDFNEQRLQIQRHNQRDEENESRVGTILSRADPTLDLNSNLARMGRGDDFDDKASVTSSIQSMKQYKSGSQSASVEGVTQYKIPSFPEDSEAGGLRKCVYCRLVLPLQTEMAWKYVYDLTFPVTCPIIQSSPARLTTDA